MNKILILIATLTMLAACGGSGGSKTNSPPASSLASSLSDSSGLSSSSSSSSVPPVSSGSSSSSATAAVLVPFVLPFDDASPGVTDLAGLNHTPAGKWGSLVADEAGHFTLNGERTRFLGVNITIGSAFPSRANAEKVAQRLAKFGVNLVRFHHIDNYFGDLSPSVINYSAGNSRSLHADNLDKLDYFIAQLKANGIYINLNLLNSRGFRAADGLPPAISELTWKQSHVLGFVNATFRNLEKEYAQQLITHRNPYTELTYAEDPAIAFVEINNENGIFQQYFDGSMDTWPAVFRADLEGHWNQWLQARYDSTAAAESAWGAVDEPLGNEKLTNPNFASGTDGWNIEQHDSAVVAAQTGTFAGRSGLQLQVTTAGAADWHVQLNQSAQSVEEGKLYTLGFRARSLTPVTLTASLQMAYDPWTTLESRQHSLNSDWQYFEMKIRAATTDNNLRINFNGFGNRLATVQLADVSFRSGGSLGALTDGESIEAGNVSGNLRAEGYTPNRNLDWAGFLRSLETNYWADMYQFIKTDLGYNGLVTGTAIMNSPPSAQKQLDFADAHAYWQHPVFPGTEWDSVNWTVENQSMVNTANNTLSGLARQRIHGIPFTVSEYQHSSPNTYGSEGPLLVAAYGALQDWDAIIFFAYDATGNDNWNARYFNDFFSINAHPTKMANMLIAANMFRRGDVAAAQQLVLMNFDPAVELDIIATRGSAWNIASGAHLNVPDELPLIHRFALDVSLSPQGTSTPPVSAATHIHTADTSELQWNLSLANRGLVTVNTAQTKSLIGFIENRVVDLDNVRIAVGATLQNWATVSLTLQEGDFNQPNAGGKLLLVATGLAENTDMQWKNSSKNSVGAQWGRAPSLIEVIPATIDLPFAAANTRAWVLNETGQRHAVLPVTNHEGKARLTLTHAAASLWYEIEIDAVE